MLFIFCFICLYFFMKTFDFALLNQGYFRGDNWNFGPICSSFSRLYLVKEGRAKVTMGGKSYSLTPGHLYLIPTLMTHYDHCNTIFGHYYLHFIDRSKQLINYYHQYELPFQLDVTNEDHMILKRLSVLCPDMVLRNPMPETYDTPIGLVNSAQRFQTLPLGLRMEVNALIMLLLSKFFQKAKPQLKAKDIRIQHTLYTIEKNLSRNFTIEDLANDVSLGKFRFIRLFKEQMGSTPTDYIIRQKIQQAQMLFIDGNQSVKDVAISLGYDNISYFTRIFKKITELTPTEFIRQNR